ncbi:uncharacterized protein LOC117111523 [Anneissia japonica]|uniref:uncharacterized protein LOC117111523 n=1 Tax=Anneissia japonica TaxID=1529436 RepID=UPI001425A202|nr:uncharacterized protein LOC117111523 [Anneissia japonica]
MAKPEGGVQEEANLAVPSTKMEEDALNDPLDPQNAELANRIKGKKSYFQITSVKQADNSGVNNEDNDSMDELDESRADDTSVISDTSKSTADLERSLRSLSPQPSNSPPLEEKSSKASVQEKGANNGNGPSRFKVVKVAHVEPVLKGRWTCKDFFHAPVTNVNVNESVNTKSVNSIVENKSEKDATNSEASSAASSVHLPGQDIVGSESTGTTDNKNKVNDTKVGRDKKESIGNQSSIEGLINELGSDGPWAPGELSHDSDGKQGYVYWYFVFLK